MRDALSRHAPGGGYEDSPSSHLIAAAGTTRELVRALATEKAVGTFPVAASVVLSEKADTLGRLLLVPALRRALRVASRRENRRLGDDLGRDFAESDDDNAAHKMTRTSTLHQRRASPAASHNDDVVALFECAMDDMTARTVIESAALDERQRLAAMIDELKCAYQRVVACLHALPNLPSPTHDSSEIEDGSSLSSSSSSRRPSVVALRLRLHALQARASALCGCFCASRAEVKLLADVLLQPEFDDVVGEDVAALEEAVSFDADEGRRAMVVLKPPRSPDNVPFASPRLRRFASHLDDHSPNQHSAPSRLEPAWRDARRARAIVRRYLRRVLVERSPPKYAAPTRAWLHRSARPARRFGGISTPSPTTMRRISLENTTMRDVPTRSPITDDDAAITSPRYPSSRRGVDQSRDDAASYFGAAAAAASTEHFAPDHPAFTISHSTHILDDDEGSIIVTNDEADAPTTLPPADCQYLDPLRSWDADKDDASLASSRQRSRQPTIIIRNSNVIIKKYPAATKVVHSNKAYSKDGNVFEDDDQEDNVSRDEYERTHFDPSPQPDTTRRLQPERSTPPEASALSIKKERHDSSFIEPIVEPLEPTEPKSLTGPSEPAEVLFQHVAAESPEAAVQLASKDPLRLEDLHTEVQNLNDAEAAASDVESEISPGEDAHGPRLRPEDIPPPADAPGRPAALSMIDSVEDDTAVVTSKAEGKLTPRTTRPMTTQSPPRDDLSSVDSEASSSSLRGVQRRQLSLGFVESTPPKHKLQASLSPTLVAEKQGEEEGDEDDAEEEAEAPAVHHQGYTPGRRPPRPPPSVAQRRARSLVRHESPAEAGQRTFEHQREASPTQTVDDDRTTPQPFSNGRDQVGDEIAGLASLSPPGVRLTKHCRHSRPHGCFLSVDAEGTEIKWTTRKRNSAEAKLRVEEIIDVKLGQATPVFERHGNPKKVAHCFSILTKFRTLDLECSSQKLRDNLVAAIRFLGEHSEL